jgi:2-alkenal reductase
MTERSPVRCRTFRRTMRHSRIVVLLLVACALGACSTSELPIVGQAATPNPTSSAGQLSPTTDENAMPSPTPARPETPLPLPTVAPVPTIESRLTTALDEEQQLLVELYRHVNPAVVSIEVTGGRAQSGEPTPEPDLPFAQGSGFLYDDQGHIVTNNHVVEDASGFQVLFSDGSISEAQLVGRDPHSDLAVLKVDELPTGAAPLPLADSRLVEVGQTAIAIGNPFGLQNTLTVGVISGLGRALDGPASAQGGRFPIPNVIQTDAAINPGNSGGPLLNIHGEVIGVNTAIRSDSGVFEGIGYAIPSNALARIIPALIRDGTYQHPWIGLSMRTVDPLLARHFGLAAKQGVLVIGVLSSSPAARADLRAGQRSGEYGGRQVPYDGDIITAINGQTVHGGDDLVGYLELETSVGDVVTLTVLRDGQEQKIEVTLAGRPEN